ncbi:SpoIID/LytB domain-containing protein [Candidatus Merdisoma sp. JLR.KK006]|uniref:SpoIID/LytB domain-containing protein n=1 Tax=Candidatus Merdisoma sp. JLR.KK006 TaxID=3112626 RepID=UPI002FEFCA9E
MGRQTDPMLKTKLYLLAIGILVLAILLVRGKSEIESPKDTENLPIKEQPKEPEPESDAEAEPEMKVPIYNGNIRVLIKTDGFAGEIHESVKLVSDQELFIHGKILDENGEQETEYGSGVELSFSWEEGSLILNGELLAEVPTCFLIGTQEEPAMPITLQSVNRGYGTPSYEGIIEVWPVEGGFAIVNEVPLETYLNYVVPSEMPSRYEQEALKAQAVCARTYAYRHLQTYGYPQYEAHVDDSVRYQVYNNTNQTESTNQAVAETGDLILTSQGQPITAYYFSTSCGYTGNEEVWWEGSAEMTPYLRGKTINEAGESLPMSDEETFTAFILNWDDTCYDREVSWYRWETELDIETLSENLNNTLKNRYEANPEAIRTKRGRNYVSKSIDTIGTIEEIEILERNEGGAIQRMCIHGSRRTIEIATEYNVRALLNVQGGVIVRQDGTTVEGGSLLPSAYFIVTPVYDDKGELSGFRFQGGGYGHGVGMSQNGANGMAKEGKGYEEILHFFYTDVELTAILDL